VIINLERRAFVNFAVRFLIGVAVLLSPCAYDTDPRGDAALAVLAAQASSSSHPPEVAASEAVLIPASSPQRAGSALR
jgi:hypothetical protein